MTTIDSHPDKQMSQMRPPQNPAPESKPIAPAQPASETEMAHPNALHYRCIETDYGGTYTHRPWQSSDQNFDPETLPAIGTFGCGSCVAVYMKLSPTTCFIAHINAAFSKPGSYPQTTLGMDLYDRRVVSEVEGGYVRDEILRLLHEESVRENWPPLEEIEPIKLACPVMEHPVSGAALSGKYIVQAVREFLHRERLTVNTESEGFVVMHDTGDVKRFPWLEKTGERPRPDNGVEYVAHKFHGDEWGRWFVDIGKLWEARHGIKERAASVEPVGCVGGAFSLGDGEDEHQTDVSGEEREEGSEEELEPVSLDLWNEDSRPAEEGNEVEGDEVADSEVEGNEVADSEAEGSEVEGNEETETVERRQSI
jgi:hypothetical protein